MKFEEKFIAFIDVLGFKNLVAAAEAGDGMSLPEIIELLTLLGSPDDSDEFEKNGPLICPDSPYSNRDLNFKITQISDCAIISSELSAAGLINLTNHCWRAVFRLLTKGIMCRGYITKGSIYHTNFQAIGSGYQNAFLKEQNVSAFRLEPNETGTPFVEIDAAVCEYVKSSNDPCVKKMFWRMAKEQDGTTALFPFKKLSHDFLFSGFGVEFDPEKERESNKNVRELIHKIKSRIMTYVDQSNENAITKSKHYIKALDSQLEICDRADELIDQLSNP